MALFTNLQSLSQTAGANPPDGSADAPSTIPTDLRLLGSFDAIMRDGGHQWGASVGGTNTISITVNGISSLVAGQTFKFVAAGANTGAVTLNVNSLGAKSVLKFGSVALAAGEIASLSTVAVTYDGTNFQLTSPPARVGPAFSAYLSANQSVTSGAATKVLIDTEDFDTASCFASSRFTPTVAGYYQVSAQISMSVVSGFTDATLHLYKNGAAFERGGQLNASGPTIFSASYAGLISMNGSTDYLELFGTLSGTTPVFGGGVLRLTKFAAFLARPA